MEEEAGRAGVGEAGRSTILCSSAYLGWLGREPGQPLPHLPTPADTREVWGARKGQCGNSWGGRPPGKWEQLISGQDVGGGVSPTTSGSPAQVDRLWVLFCSTSCLSELVETTLELFLVLPLCLQLLVM